MVCQARAVVVWCGGCRRSMTFLFPVRSQQGAMEGRPPAPPRVSMFRRLMVRVTPAERLAADDKEREKEERPAAAGDAEVGRASCRERVYGPV